MKNVLSFVEMSIDLQKKDHDCLKSLLEEIEFLALSFN